MDSPKSSEALAITFPVLLELEKETKADNTSSPPIGFCITSCRFSANVSISSIKTIQGANCRAS